MTGNGAKGMSRSGTNHLKDTLVLTGLMLVGTCGESSDVSSSSSSLIHFHWARFCIRKCWREGINIITTSSPFTVLTLVFAGVVVKV